MSGNNTKLQFQDLNDKWTKKHRELQEKILTTHKDSIDWISNNSKQVAVGSLAGLFLLTSPMIPKLPGAPLLLANEKPIQDIDKSVFLVADLSKLLPDEVGPLTTEQEKNVGEILTRTFGFNVSADLEGKRLNTSYGKIGAEQHLARYPGDTMATHFDNEEDARKYWSSGMAPGLGAWRYFTNSYSEMTEKDKLREEYYIAVQTFLAPGFNENVKEYVDFFKFRKMLVVNPQNGKAVVAVIGDAGPAVWTGKSLGGSPEVMSYLERVDGKQAGPVLYYFVDDPEDKIPLGPVKL